MAFNLGDFEVSDFTDELFKLSTELYDRDDVGSGDLITGTLSKLRVMEEQIKQLDSSVMHGAIQLAHHDKYNGVEYKYARLIQLGLEQNHE